MKTIRLEGIVGLDFDARSVASQLEGEKDVNLIINSPGGFVFDGFAIYNALTDHDGKVTARLDLAASAASVISMAADEISMYESSSLMMIHEVSGAAFGSKKDMEKAAMTAQKLENMIIDLYQARTGLDKAKLAQMVEDETWLDADEAVEMGFADKVLRTSRTNLMNVILSAMKGEANHPELVNIKRFAEKVDKMAEKSNNMVTALSNADSLKDIEGALRDEVGLSIHEATALVSKIKAVSPGDRGDTNEILSKINYLSNKVSP